MIRDEGKSAQTGREARFTGVTRLAPSPTGALHLGNARTFLVNWALARRAGWRVVMRVEDLDTPRVKAGAIEETLDVLAWLGLDWDGDVEIQSEHAAGHADAMRTLARAGVVYPCELTRAQIEAAASAPQEGSGEVRFPPELRPGSIGPAAFEPGGVDGGANWRFVVPTGEVTFMDAFRGEQRIDPAASIGDFVVWTKRGQAAYQLAVVVDDARAGVTQVVRGDDLLDSTARQLLISRALGVGPEPAYTHLPLVRGGDGRRLAKRHGDTRITAYRGRGVGAERVVGVCAYWCGVSKGRVAMDAAEFRDRLALGRIPPRDVVFGAEDEAWLLDA